MYLHLSLWGLAFELFFGPPWSLEGCLRAASLVSVWTWSHAPSVVLMESLCLVCPMTFPRTWAVLVSHSQSFDWPQSPYENGGILYSWQFPSCPLIRVYPRWELLVLLGLLYPSSIYMTKNHVYSPTGNIKCVPELWWENARPTVCWAILVCWPGTLPPEPGGWAVLTPFSSLLHLTPESCHALPTNPEIGFLFVCSKSMEL